MSVNDPAIVDYSHIITTRPHDICRVLISDLHLSADEPALVQAFLALIDDLKALANLNELYILGDWFDAWVGDDRYLTLSSTEFHRNWLTPIIETLSELSAKGCDIKVMHGNRDFLIGQEFCDLFNAELIHEPYFIHINDKSFRLEHGDALCTDDKSYQRFRTIMRNPVTQWLLLKRPLQKRIALAQRIRTKSSMDKSHKSMSIMDVNHAAVLKVLNKVDGLIHGHTHRPAKHEVIVDKKNHTTKPRYVLGDWRVIHRDSAYEQVEAIIAISYCETTYSDRSLLYDQKQEGAGQIEQNFRQITSTQLANEQHSIDKSRLDQKESLQLVKFEIKT
ncbi:UDP-2,3-diacylglucosamine diphosphatase [Psychrobacter sp.]|uniref:UDP-2,3-diacylglucosamine diphosphatase n=1 Tax=Psychrobacter sp. TaxID=56811 RepID=UPI0025E1AB42|nr:UDP-2,3-diacylglucosamine diphosphatase [Psychrobacter sp.]